MSSRSFLARNDARYICILLNAFNKLYTFSAGGNKTISSTKIKGKFYVNISDSFSSKSCITMSANIDDNGDFIGVPNICLYITLSKVKNVEVSRIE